MKKTLKILCGAAFAVYILILLYALFMYGRGNVYTRDLPLAEYAQIAVNLTPFETIRGFWTALKENRINTDIALLNIFGNIALFVPFGVFLPLSRARLRALWKTCAVAFAAVLAAESLQLLFKAGSFDVDDIILNLAGVVIGYAGFKVLYFIYKKTPTGR